MKNTTGWYKMTKAVSETAKRDISIGKVIRERHPSWEIGKVMKVAKRFNRIYQS